MTSTSGRRAEGPTVRYRLDDSVRRFGTTLIGGSPLRLFRLTHRGAAVVDSIASGDDAPAGRLVDTLVDAGAVHPVPPSSGRYRVDDVTIVVPTLGPTRHLPPGALVVDDGSQPPVEGASVRLPDNRGPAAARNAGLGAVTTPIVAFVDADVLLAPGWLEPLLGHFDDERVALVAPRVRSRRTAGALGRYERRSGPLDLGPSPARIRAGTRVSYVPAAALVCRVDALRAVGGFDESMRVGEDVDLVWRLDAEGWRCRYEPTVVVEHEPRSGWRAWARQRFAYGSSAGPLALRHPHALAPVRASGWSVGAWLLVALGHPVAGISVGVGSSLALIRKLPQLPPRTAFALAATGHLRAGTQLATACRRAWWPLLVPLATRSRTARRVLLAGFVASRHPVRAADDLAYSLGVWAGAARARTLGPLLPDLTSWPSGTRRPRPAQPARRTDPLPSSG